MRLRYGRFLLFLGILMFLAAPASFSLELGVPMSLASSGIQTQRIFSDGYSQNVRRISLSFPEPFTGRSGRYTALNIEGCSAADMCGYQLPVKVITLDCPAGTHLSSVKITGGKWQEIEGRLSLPPSSSSSLRRMGGNGTGSSSLYPAGSENNRNEDAFLPGTFIEAGPSPAAGGAVLSISVFPVQFNPVTGKALFLRSAEVEICYGRETESVPQVLAPLAAAGEDGYSTQSVDDPFAQCLIITPRKYLPMAEQLKAVHEGQKQKGMGDKITTTIITTEEIAGCGYGLDKQPPLASPNELCPEGGFETRTGVTYHYRNMLANSYNYHLARKILSFLLDCREAPDYKQNETPGGYYAEMPFLQHIVILGNGTEVPPSYYAYSSVTGDSESYENYLPTDYFYAACSKRGLEDLYPYAAVGRFPVAGEKAVEVYSGLTIGEVSAENVITISGDVAEPAEDLAGMMIVITSGAAKNRWLDIKSYTWNAGELKLYLDAAAWVYVENRTEQRAIDAGNKLDIIDTRPQMQEMIDKVEQWVDDIGGDNSWFRNISFAGGTYKSAFNKNTNSGASMFFASLSSLYWGELSCVEAINKVDENVEGGDGLSYVSGLNVKKYFATDITDHDPLSTCDDDAFIVSDIKEILDHRAPAGILYFAGDGWRDMIVIEDGGIDSSFLLNDCPLSSKSGLIVSQASATAAFDEDITDGSSSSCISFGRAALMSKAGAIAYFGPTRTAKRSLHWSRAEDGLLVHSQTRANEMTMNFLKFYHRAGTANPTINRIVSQALGAYYMKNLAFGTNKEDFRILVEYNLLGSPAIYVPAPFPAEEYAGVPVAEPLDRTRTNSDNIPCYEVEDGKTIDITVSFDSASDSNELKLVDARYYTCDDKTLQASSSGEYTFPLKFDDKDTGPDDNTNGPGLYFVRVSQKEKDNERYTKENRYYFEVVNRFIPAGDILIIDDDQPRRYVSSSIAAGNGDGTESAWQYMYPDFDDPLPQTSQNPFEGGDYYRDALNVLGYAEGADYKVWHVENKNGTNDFGEGRHGEVTQEVLMQYLDEGEPYTKAVIWFTGNDYFSTLLPNEITALQEFLDGGGKLFITGQDIGYDIGATTFYTSYLRAKFVQDNVGKLVVDGIMGDELSDGLNDINISGTGGAFNQLYPSEIDPQGGAMPCFFYDIEGGAGPGKRLSSGSAALRYYNEDTGAAVVYFSFGFEAINHDDPGMHGSSRRAVMNSVLNWLLDEEKEPTTGNLDATGQDEAIDLDWKNLPVGGILIVCRESDGYPTGDPPPEDGRAYAAGEETAGGTVVYFSSAASATGSFTHRPLVNETTYYYRAYSVASGNIYTFFDIASATPRKGGVIPGELAAPSNLTAMAVKELETWRIELAWTDNSADPGEDGFRIARKEGSGGVWNDAYAEVAAGIQSYVDDLNVNPGVMYFYRVQAFKNDPASVSAWSNEASAATSYLEAPANLRAIGGEREVWLYWQFNSLGADGFKIQRRHPTPFKPADDWVNIADVPAGITSYTDALRTAPNLPDGRPYYYRIKAYNNMTETEWSNEAWTNPVPSAFSPGEDPTGFNVLAGGEAMTLVVKFNDNTDNESGYEVELWRKPPNFIESPVRTELIPPLSGKSFTDTAIVLNFTSGGKYYVRVIAIHKNGYGKSRYCRVSGGSATDLNPYVSFSLPGVVVDTDDMGSCFIATAAFGSPYEKNVRIFREFRDRHLMRWKAGRAFVRWYYRHSPAFADCIRKRPVARAFVRAGLRPLAWILSFVK